MLRELIQVTHAACGSLIGCLHAGPIVAQLVFIERHAGKTWNVARAKRNLGGLLAAKEEARQNKIDALVSEKHRKRFSLCDATR